MQVTTTLKANKAATQLFCNWYHKTNLITNKEHMNTFLFRDFTCQVGVFIVWLSDIYNVHIITNQVGYYIEYNKLAKEYPFKYKEYEGHLCIHCEDNIPIIMDSYQHGVIHMLKLINTPF